MKLRTLYFILALAGFLIVFPPRNQATEETSLAESNVCKPSAFTFLPNSNCLLVGDAFDGDLMRVDLASNEVARLANLGGQVADIAFRLSHNQLLVLLADKQQLILLSLNAGSQNAREQLTCNQLDLLQLGGDPKHICLSSDGKAVLVTHRWHQRVDIVKLGQVNFESSPQQVALPFSANRAFPLDSTHYVIADAFGGRLASIDVNQPDSCQVFEFRGHNIGGLTLSLESDKLLVSHQLHSSVARADFDDIHWGNLIQNVVSQFPLAFFKSDDTDIDLNSHRKIIYLGDTGRGFADPGDILDTEQGLIVVSRGTGTAMLLSSSGERSMMPVGRYPAQLLRVGMNRFATIGRHSADLSFFSVDQPASREPSGSASISLGDLPTSSTDQGEDLFFDARLSHDGWMSCSSCHVDGHTAGLKIDTLGDGAFGNPKIVPSLLGLADTAPYGWLGNKQALHDQLIATLRNTMHGNSQPNAAVSISEMPTTDAERQTIDQLTAFIISLSLPQTDSAHTPENFSSPSHDASPPGEESPGKRNNGKAIFEKFRCGRCHQEESLTSTLTYDVGFSDELGQSCFNPPSLRAVRFRKPLFHDGRATDLSDAFFRWKHQLPDDADPQEVAALISYLRSL